MDVGGKPLLAWARMDGQNPDAAFLAAFNECLRRSTSNRRWRRVGDLPSHECAEQEDDQPGLGEDSHGAMQDHRHRSYSHRADEKNHTTMTTACTQSRQHKMLAMTVTACDPIARSAGTYLRPIRRGARRSEQGSS